MPEAGVEDAETGGEFGSGQAALAVEAAGGSLWLHPAAIGGLPVFAISFPFNPFDAQSKYSLTRIVLFW